MPTSLEHQDLILDSERPNQEKQLFSAIEDDLEKILRGPRSSGHTPWQEALAKYKMLPAEFLKNNEVSTIAHKIYQQAKADSLTPEEIISTFTGNLDLLAAVSPYSKSDFSVADQVKIVEETYQKRGACEYLAKYNIKDFPDPEQEKILKPLFDSYKIYNPGKILLSLELFKNYYDQLPPDEHDQLIKTLTSNFPSEVFDKLDWLNLKGEEKKFLIENFKQYGAYQYLQSEKNLEKLGSTKEEIIADLSSSDPINLFVRRHSFKLAPQQYEQLLEKITGDVQTLEKTLIEIYYGYPEETKQLNAAELLIFKTAIEKIAPYLIFRFNTVFKKARQEQLSLLFKEIPTGLEELGLERFMAELSYHPESWEANLKRLPALFKEAREQKVTTEYLEQLDTADLKLPNRVLLKIKENIRHAEQKNLLNYVKIALEKNTSLEQAQRAAQEKLEQVTAQAHYFKAINVETLKNVLQDRRFKTQFETHSSAGTLDPHYRAQQEERMFNYKSDETKGQTVRPNYGYLSDNEHGLVGATVAYPTNSNVIRYGKIHVKFKKDKIAKQTTVTFEDSLEMADKVPPSPAIKPHFTSLEKFHYAERMEQASCPSAWGSGYLEAQYHWPLRASFIESIHISRSRLNAAEINNIEEAITTYNEQNEGEKRANNKIKIIFY